MLHLCVVFAALSELIAGATIRRISNDPRANEVRVNGVGSGAFDPGKFSTWHFDHRAPLIHAKPGGHCPDAEGNIYNANCVNNGKHVWNCFFGGWDGVDSCHDSISVSVTEDDFTTLSSHVPVIATGTTHNLNNPSAIKSLPNSWLMVYTQEHPQDGGMVNKPGISASNDGLSFNPREGGQHYLVMNAYPNNWTRADVNGGNVLLEVVSPCLTTAHCPITVTLVAPSVHTRRFLFSQFLIWRSPEASHWA